jgi:signal transduction histidine kinase
VTTVGAICSTLTPVMALLDRIDPPVRRRRGWLLQAVMLVAALLAFLQAANELGDRHAYGTAAAQVLVAAAIALPVALLPRRPLLAWWIAWLTAAVTGPFHVGDVNPWPWIVIQVFILAAALVAVAVRHSAMRLVWVLLGAWLLIVAFIGGDNRLTLLVVVALLLIGGDLVRRRREAQRRLVEQEELTELEQARRAVLEERTRIARELHDVVAHHMSLIAVRAETAPYRFAAVPDDLAREFVGIAENSREALAEMRRLLGVLRSDGPPEREPQPGLAELPGLVTAAREAGVEVSLSMSGAGGSVPAPVGLTAYRVVQEALSNARRHAPGGAVRIDVSVADALAVDVVNNAGTAGGLGIAPGAAPDPAHPPHGLAGMRDRAESLGGTLRAEPTAEGGFALRAELPLRSADAD